MQPSETAFDRVKSLLGKMDRSIDDARRRRLHDPEDQPEDQITQPDHANTDQSATAGTNGSNGMTNDESSPAPAPARPVSKYGRAKPLNEIPTQNGPNWRTA
jgi:hypothetical protein